MKEVLKIATNKVKKYLVGVLICSLIMSKLTVKLTKYISYIIDGVIMQKIELPQYLINSFYSDETTSKLAVTAAYMAIFVLIISMLNYVKSMFLTKAKLKMNKNLKFKLLEHTTYLEYTEYSKYEKSQILQRVNSDSNEFIDFVISKYDLIVDIIFSLIFSMYEIININYIVSLIIGIILLIITIMSIVYLKITKPIVQKNIELHEDLIAKTINAVYNAKMIKIYNREQKEIDDFNKVSEEYRKNDTKLIDYLIFYELIGTGMRKFKTPVIFLLGGILAINGKMNIGELMILMTYSSSLLESMVQFIYIVNKINAFLIPTYKINEFLKLNEESKENKIKQISDTSLEFKDVSIKMSNSEILSNISFKISRRRKCLLGRKQWKWKKYINKGLVRLFGL